MHKLIMCTYVFFFGFCFALTFLKVPYFVSFYVSFSCLNLILSAFCDASASEEMQTRRPSAAISCHGLSHLLTGHYLVLFYEA